MATSAEKKSIEQKSVEMPRPTAWPLVIALGITLVMLGAATNLFFSIVGGVLFVISLVGWVFNLLPGRGHENEPLSRAAPEPIVARPGTVTQLKPGVVGYRFQLPEKVHPVSAGIRGGIVGGLLMPIPALIWGAFLSGHGIWFPVNLLAGTVVPGLNEYSPQQLEQFHPWIFAGALVLHVLMSIGFGLIGGVLLPTLPQIPGGPLLFGGLILPLLWSGANHSMMGIVNPVLNRYIDWPWYVVSQLVYGIATSIVILRSEKIPIAPRGRGGHGGGRPMPPTVLGAVLLTCLALSGCNRDWEKLPGKPELKTEFVMPQDIMKFDVLYAQRCAACHGADGALGVGPPLNDPLFAALVTEDDLKSVISEGRHGTLMPAWSQSAGGPLTADQVAALVEGIKNRHWASSAQASSQAVYPSAPPLRTPKVIAAGNIEAGEKVFAIACAGCHGSHGVGGEMAGAINDSAFLSLISDELLRRYVITGRPDLDMPNFAEHAGRDKDFRPLTSEEIGNLVNLLAQWRSRAATP